MKFFQKRAKFGELAAKIEFLFEKVKALCTPTPGVFLQRTSVRRAGHAVCLPLWWARPLEDTWACAEPRRKSGAFSAPIFHFTI